MCVCERDIGNGVCNILLLFLVYRQSIELTIKCPNHNHLFCQDGDEWFSILVTHLSNCCMFLCSDTFSNDLPVTVVLAM